MVEIQLNKCVSRLFRLGTALVGQREYHVRINTLKSLVDCPVNRRCDFSYGIGTLQGSQMRES